MNWPVEDRPREKLLQKGAQHLTDAELIAIFIKTGVKGKTAVDIAKGLLIEYNGLKQLLRAPIAALIQQPGIGQTKYVTLQAALELGKRYLSEMLPTGTILNNSQLTQQFLADRLRCYTNEVFCCLFMDNRFRLIQFEELFHGTINEASIYPREIVKRSLAHGAAKIILAHNHPTGLSEPSNADKEVTKLIKAALALVDIAVVDHVIVGNPGCFSFANAGLL